MTADEGPRADTSLEKLARLRPAFREGGTVTAGNASTLNDGAACLVLASRARAQGARGRAAGPHRLDRRRGRRPRVYGNGAGAGDPAGARRRRPDLDDIDLVEINEAFAAQVLACVGELGIDEERLNVNGGAIALGHPLGCSGARILTTLVWELRRRGGRYGIAALCVGVGRASRRWSRTPRSDSLASMAADERARERRRAISPTTEATIPLPDDGLYRGDGVFEVIRLYEGRPSRFATTWIASSARRPRSSCRWNARDRTEIDALSAEFGTTTRSFGSCSPAAGAGSLLTETLPELGRHIAWPPSPTRPA